MVRMLGGLMLLALGASATAQSVAPGPAASAPGASAAALTPMERARRDADKVFYWVKLHGNAPAKVAPATATKEPETARPAAAPSANPAAAVKRPTPAVRTAEVPVAAATEDPTTSTRARRDSGGDDQSVASETVIPTTQVPAAAEPTAPTEAKVVEPQAQAKEPASTAARGEPDPPASAASAPPPASTDAIEPPVRADSADEGHAPVSAAALPRPAAPDDRIERLQPVAQPAPEFPAAVVQALRRGSVRVQFSVMPDGSVAAVDVVSSSSPRLNQAALAAVAQWRFQPVTHPQPAQVDLAFSID